MKKNWLNSILKLPLTFAEFSQIVMFIILKWFNFSEIFTLDRQMTL